MDSRKCKICTTIFGIFFSGIILSEWNFKGIILFMWILVWLSAAISFLAKWRRVNAHHGISFSMAIILSVVLLMTENFMIQGMICVSILFFGLMALYRTCYQRRESISTFMLRDMKYLFFANLTRYLYPIALTKEEKDKRTLYEIAVVTAFLCFVLFAGLDRFADIHIADLLHFLWEIFSENIAYIMLSIVMGVFLASALYGYLYGLSTGQLEQLAKDSNIYSLALYAEEKNLWVKLFCNPICGILVLNIVIFCNSILLIANLFYYWNPFGLDFGASGIVYRSSGFVMMLIIIALCGCIFGGINHILEYGKTEAVHKDADIDVSLFEKCRRRLIAAVVVTFLIWVFAAARYCNILYASGINNSNKQGMFGLLACIIVLVYFLLHGSSKPRHVIAKAYFYISVASIILSVFLWCGITFPLYNMFLFENKLEHQQLTYSFTGLSDGELVITEKDIDIYFMEESGLYAVPFLVKLLEYANTYEGSEGSVADAALGSIERIFSEEFYKNRQDINAVEGTEKLSVIAQYMEEDPSYLIGIRRACWQSVMRYISRHNQRP